jgi:hypothetical protein
LKSKKDLTFRILQGLLVSLGYLTQEETQLALEELLAMLNQWLTGKVIFYLQDIKMKIFQQQMNKKRNKTQII